MRTLLVFDATYLCHQAKHAYKQITLNGYNGVVFGFLKKTLQVMEMFDKPEVVFAWDGPGSIRKKMYPAYKEHRKHLFDEGEARLLNELGFPQFHLIKDEILYEIGFLNIFQKEGFEADDFMANLAYRYGYKFNVVLVTADNDLYQCLHMCRIFNPKKNDFFTMDDLEREYGIDPFGWITVKCIAGCNGDNVKGIDGIGEKRAIAYVNDKEDSKNKKWFKKIEEQFDRVIDQNFPLVALPLDSTPSFKIKQGSKFNLKAYAEICNRYDMRSLIKEDVIKRWEKVF